MLAVYVPTSLSIWVRNAVPPSYVIVCPWIAWAMVEKSSALLAGRPRNNIAGLREKFSSTYSMHFAVNSAREDFVESFTRTASGNRSRGSAKNSGKPPPVEPGRNCLSLSFDLNLVTRSFRGKGSKMLAVTVLVFKCEETR